MPLQQSFYVTTPIYYGNGPVHVGHFYSSSIANIIHLQHRAMGYESRFTTGIDENSQKAVIKAREQGMKIMDYLNMMAADHQRVWDYFGMQYTDFIRTTESRHHQLVQEVLQHCYDKGDIYQGEYEGKYCVGCEAFKKDDELIERDDKMLCADHLTIPDEIKEKNYFFKLSKYQTWIEEFYTANPDFVLPDFRYNEVKSFVAGGLEDFSISRETNTFGIPLPFDHEQVTYVWFDALFNYYTSVKYSRGGDKKNKNFIDEMFLWPPNLHVVGKDIIRFHAIFWPAMLASFLDLGEDRGGVLHYLETDAKKLPQNILTGGFFTVDGQKMSKSLGNVIEPVEYADSYGKELLTLYMLSAFPVGNDGDYDRAKAIETYNAKLANNLGNLLNRVVVLSLKLSENSGKLDGVIDEKISSLLAYLQHALYYEFTPEQVQELKTNLGKYDPELSVPTSGSVRRYDHKATLDLCFEMLDKVNAYVHEMEPWKVIKEDEEKAKDILSSCAEALRQVGMHLYPFFPEKMSEMLSRLGYSDYASRLDAGELYDLLASKDSAMITEKGSVLFQRIEN